MPPNLPDATANDGTFRHHVTDGESDGVIVAACTARGALHAGHRVSDDIGKNGLENAIRDRGKVHRTPRVIVGVLPPTEYT